MVFDGVNQNRGLPVTKHPRVNVDTREHKTKIRGEFGTSVGCRFERTLKLRFMHTVSMYKQRVYTSPSHSNLPSMSPQRGVMLDGGTKISGYGPHGVNVDIGRNAISGTRSEFISSICCQYWRNCYCD